MFAEEIYAKFADKNFCKKCGSQLEKFEDNIDRYFDETTGSKIMVRQVGVRCPVSRKSELNHSNYSEKFEVTEIRED